MATGQWPTLADVTSRLGGDSKPLYIAEMLSQAIELTADMPFKEANEIGGHEFSFRTSIPTGYFRQINQGVPYGKSTTGKSRLGVASLEGFSQVDRLLAEASGSIPQFRESEDVAFIEGMGQTMEETSFYGNTATAPAEFMGLSSFYNTLTQSSAQNAQNVINGGGVASSNASIWLVCWGERTIYSVYPRGSRAGLVSEDWADQTPAYDNLGNPFPAYTTYFRQQMGIIPEDWRFGVRIANIDVTAAGLAGPTALDLFVAMNQMVMLPPMLSKQSSGVTKTDAPTYSVPGIRPVIYCNRSVRGFMDVQGMRDRNVLLSLNDAAGKVQDMFRGIPIKISDRLLTTEDTVS